MRCEGNACPRCSAQCLVSIPGGWHCLACGHEEVEDSLSLYAELMAAIPGAPLPIDKATRHDDEMRWASDVALAEEAARRHGVSLEELRVNMLRWRSMPGKTRYALQSAIADLTIANLGIHRIAKVLNKSCRTITKSPGLARGRARRRSPVALAAHGGCRLSPQPPLSSLGSG